MILAVSIISAVGAIVAARIGRDVTTVKREMRSNGGASMRDAIDRIDRKTDGMAHRVDTIGYRLEEHLTLSGDAKSGLSC